MNILNNHSRLNKLKIYNGIKILNTVQPNAYIVESRIKKYLLKYEEGVHLNNSFETDKNIRIHNCINRLSHLSSEAIFKISEEIDKEKTFDEITSLIYNSTTKRKKR